MAYLTDEALAALEKERPNGLNRHEVLAVFADAGDRFSSSLLSTYLAWGLLPTTKRRDEGYVQFPVSSIRIINRIRRKVIEKVSYRELRDQRFGTEAFAREAIMGCLAELRRLALRIEQKVENTNEHKTVRERIERIRVDTEYVLRIGDRIADA